MSNTSLKPIIKWAGGKTQIIENIMSYFPVSITNYYEPFLGGGSVLFSLLDKIEEKKICVNKTINAFDINKNLINVYKTIKYDLYNFMSEMDKLSNEYLLISELNGERNPLNLADAKKSKESFYYWIRKKYNNLQIDDDINIMSAVYFVFLNKTGFRGLYREGPNGFNVPFGNYKNPCFYDKTNLENVNNKIQRVNFECLSFENVFSRLNKGDFIYLDPPYYPENDKSFTKYNKDDFTEHNHNELFKLTNDLVKKNINFLMSNSKTDYVENYFIKNTNINIDEIEVKRRCNSKNPESKTNELLIYFLDYLSGISSLSI